MIGLRRTIFTVISVTAFLALAIIASVEYNDNDEKSTEIKESKVYSSVEDSLKIAEKIFSGSKDIENDGDLREGIKENVSKLPNKIKEYIQIEKTESGWNLILKNSKGVIFEKNISLK
jgi:hypothetical protein